MNIFSTNISLSSIKLYVSFLILLVPGIFYAQSKGVITDWEQLNLNGKVKSSIMDMKNSFDLKSFNVPDLFFSYYFDENGYIIESYDNLNHSFSKNTYNKNKKIIRIETENKKNKLNWLNTYEYDLRGNLIKEKQYFKNKLSTIIINRYDYKDRNIVKEYYNENGELKMEEILRHDKYDRLFNNITFVTISGIYYDTYWKRNDKGQVLQKLSSTSKKETGKKRYKLDEEYVYDKNGTLLQKTNHYLGSTTITNYKKDEQRNEIEERLFSADKESEVKTTTKIEYKYDNKNNWTTKKVYENEKLKTQLVRNIEYYDDY